MTDMAEQTLTVSEVGAVVRAALESTMPYGVWVEGEIRSISRSRNGHVYFDLVEPSESEHATPVATIPVVLFRDARDRVNRLLKRHGDPIRMNDGVRIRIQGMVDFYPPSGRIQLRMSAIDPTFTLGVLAAERDALLAALAEAGLLDANRRHPLPAVPLRVALVTSLGSAAHADITTVFEQSRRAFTLVEIDTAVQGQGAEVTIAAAIRTAGQAAVDVVIVARGGGSKTDLAAFDHGDVARAIAASPVPVFTGIGHDIDRAVADEVAHTAATTPTGAAQAVVALVEEWLDLLTTREAQIAHRARTAVAAADARLERNRRQTLLAAGSALRHAEARLQSGSARLATSSRRVDHSARARLDHAADRVERSARRVLRSAELRLDTFQSRARSLDPTIALARGWSITRGPDGQVVRSTHAVAPGTEVITQVADGTLRSTISAVEEADQ